MQVWRRPIVLIKVITRRLTNAARSTASPFTASVKSGLVPCSCHLVAEKPLDLWRCCTDAVVSVSRRLCSGLDSADAA